jgi:hypothetical protein
MKKRIKGAPAAECKATKSDRLAASKIAKAREILGAPTDPTASEVALDLVNFRAELVGGAKAMRGTRIRPFDGE